MDEPAASPGRSTALMIDLTPGAIMIADAEGQAEPFESIGDALQYILTAYRAAEQGEVTHGDFLAGYSEGESLSQRDPTAADSASARRA